MNDEAWIQCSAFPRYDVSSSGKIRPRVGKFANVVLKTWPNRVGYPRVRIRRDKKPHKPLLHKLIWESFNGPVPLGLELNHKDLNKNNSSLSNLELATRGGNVRHYHAAVRARKASSSRDRYSPGKQEGGQGRPARAF